MAQKNNMAQQAVSRMPNGWGKVILLLLFALILLTKECSGQPVRIHASYRVFPEYETIVPTDFWIIVTTDTLYFDESKFVVKKISFKTNSDIIVYTEWHGGTLCFKFIRRWRLIAITNNAGRRGELLCWIYLEGN